MGNSSSQINSNSLSKNEADKIQEFYSSKFKQDKTSQNQIKNLEIFSKEVFKNLLDSYKINLKEYMNKAYQKALKTSLKEFDLKAFILFCEIILKSTNSEEAFLSSIYQNCSYLYLLYDLTQSSPAEFRSNSIEKEIIENIIDYAIEIYVNLHDESVKEGVKIRCNKENMKKYLNNLIAKTINIGSNQREIEARLFNPFISEYLISFDCLIKDHFNRIILENNKINMFTSNAVPTFQLGVSNIMSTEEFFFFCMANPFVSNRKNAYKLYCCNQMGFNISSVIYSFLGFDGPICIFISHLTKDNSKKILGLFLNSNFKECFENYVGDDCCFPFELSPNMKFYKIDPYSVNKNKILYLSSKNHKNTNMKPGIGLGFGYSGAKMWLDMNDPFKLSYFNKNETVYQEGSPFESDKEMLNVFLFLLI